MTLLYHPRPERWPQVSIKGLVVLVTVCCVGLGWLGWQMQIVRHRKAILSQFVDNNGIINPTEVVGQRVEVRRPVPGYRVSAIRKLLGDQQVQVLMLNWPVRDADQQTFDAFPEASIQAVPFTNRH